MKTPPSNPEFARFTIATRDILKVSPEQMKERDSDQKDSGKRLSKGSACLSPAASELLPASFSKS